MNWFKAFWRQLKEAARESAGARPFDDTLQDFTPRAQAVVGLAQKHAVRLNHAFVGTEHLLLGLIEFGQGVAFNVLRRQGLDLDAVRQEVERCTGRGDGEPVSSTPLTPRLKKVLSLARQEAAALRHTYVGTEHLLLGLLREADGVAGRVLMQFRVELTHTREEVLRELDPNFFPEDDAQSGHGPAA